MRASFFLLGGLALLMLAACNGSKPKSLSQDSINELRRGMSYFQVWELLGSPTEDVTHGSERSCTWNNSGWVVVVDFTSDKVCDYAAVERQRHDGFSLAPPVLH